MAYETKPSFGALFKNKNKQQENHPDYRGDVVTPEGVKYEIAAWLKESANGSKYMSLKLSVPRAAAEEGRGTATSPVRSTQRDLDDEIPF